MSRIPNQYHRYHDRPTAQVPPEPQEPKRRFRIAWVLAPLSLLGMFYILGYIQPVLSWDDILDLLHVKNRERYSMLFVLGLLVTGAVAVRCIWGNNKKDD